jgi:hypothetical protein
VRLGNYLKKSENHCTLVLRKIRKPPTPTCITEREEIADWRLSKEIERREKKLIFFKFRLKFLCTRSLD